MKSYIVVGLIGAALGCLLGVQIYKRLTPPPQQQTPAIVQDDKSSTETRTIWRYETKEGKPVVKEIITTNVVEKHVATTPPAIERRKNLLGIQSTVDGKGHILVGPQLGRELFENVYVTGGVLLTPQGQPKAATAGLLIRF